MPTQAFFARVRAVLVLPVWLAFVVVLGSSAPAVWGQPAPATLLEEPISLPEELGGGEIGGDVVFQADQFDFNALTGQAHLIGAVEVVGDNFLILADELFLDPETQSGYARGNVYARLNDSVLILDSLVMDPDTAVLLARNIQLAVAEFANATARSAESRPDGKTLLDFVSYTPCQTCLNNGVEPLWHVEARRVELDQNTKQLHLHGVTLHLFGLPVLPLPYLQTVAPGETRVTGLLRPVFESQTGADTAIGLPYFLAFNDSIDLTIAPQVYVNDWLPIGGELSLEYRQAIANGEINADLTAGGMVEDLADGPLSAGADRVDGEIRLFGHLGLTEHIRLNWDWTETTDEDFDEVILGEAAAWTENRIAAEGYFRRSYLEAKVVDYRPANTAVDPLDLRPDFFPVVELDVITDPNHFGLTYRTHADFRYIERGGQAREYARVASDNSLNLPLHLGGGVVATTQAGFRADAYFIQNNDLLNDELIATNGTTFTGDKTRVVPYWQAKLDWPIAFVGKDSASIINPTIAVTWVSEINQVPEIPNEDNRHSELDAGNLMAINRSGGWDWIERGTRIDLGLQTRSVTSFDDSVFDPEASSSFTLNSFIGLGVKLDAIDQFDANSGLDRDLTELVADFDGSLTNFVNFDVDSRWDLESQELTRGLATSTLSLPNEYSLTARVERQTWQETNTWDEQLDLTLTGLVPFTQRQKLNVGYTLVRNSEANNSQWLIGGLSGELGSGDFLYPWKYDLEYHRRVDGSFGQEVHAEFGYDCDCADFFIDTKFTSSVVGEWDADVTFKFDFATLIEDVELKNLESLFGY